jgi:hypothetical protein
MTAGKKSRSTTSRRSRRFQRWGPGSLALLCYLYTTSVLGKRIGLWPFLRAFYPKRKRGNLYRLTWQMRKWLGELHKLGLVSDEKTPGFGGNRVWQLRRPETGRIDVSDIADMLTIYLRFSPMQNLWHAPVKRLKRWTLEELVEKYKASWPLREQ